MRICDEHRLIFVSTPKSGSHTGWKLMDDNFKINESSMHQNIVPHSKREYNAFTFVRNPYSRAVALWNSLLWSFTSDNALHKRNGLRYRKEFMKKVGGDTFSEFCTYLANLDRTKPSDWNRTLVKSQYFYHSITNLTNLKYFQLETLNDTLPEYLLEITGKKIELIPYELKRKHKTWEELSTEEDRDNIIKWAKEDFELYGYEM